jgi:hypothetical protein
VNGIRSGEILFGILMQSVHSGEVLQGSVWSVREIHDVILTDGEISGTSGVPHLQGDTISTIQKVTPFDFWRDISLFCVHPG